jgi:hypothetical protein
MKNRPHASSTEVTHQSILRVDLSAGRWQAIPAALINDDRLGLDTRGFAAWLLARPAGWEIRATALPQLLSSGTWRVGREKAQRFLRELERATYLTRTRRRGLNGCWIWDFSFRPTPSREETPSITIDGLAVGGSAVDGSAVNGQPVHYLHTLTSNRLDQYKTKPTTTAPSAQEMQVVVGELMEIRFPKFLTGHHLAAARKRISECPREHRQAVLDEFGAMMARGVVRFPMGLLKCLVRRAAEGEFVPNRSRSAAVSKTHSAGSLRSPQTGSQPTRDSALRPVADIARKVLSDLHAKFDPEAP